MLVNQSVSERRSMLVNTVQTAFTHVTLICLSIACVLRENYSNEAELMLASLKEKSRADNKTSVRRDHQTFRHDSKIGSQNTIPFSPEILKNIAAAARSYSAANAVVVFVLNLLKAPL